MDASLTVEAPVIANFVSSSDFTQIQSQNVRLEPCRALPALTNQPHATNLNLQSLWKGIQCNGTGDVESRTMSKGQRRADAENQDRD